MLHSDISTMGTVPSGYDSIGVVVLEGVTSFVVVVMISVCKVTGIEFGTDDVVVGVVCDVVIVCGIVVVGGIVVVCVVVGVVVVVCVVVCVVVVCGVVVVVVGFVVIAATKYIHA